MSTRSSILRTTCAAVALAGLALTSALSAPPKKSQASGKTDAESTGGTYYLTEAVSVTTDAGITSAKAGTMVTRVGGAPGGMRVRMADGTTLNVTHKQVTTDAAKGAALADGEAARQAAIAAQNRAEQAAAAAAEAERQRNAQQAAAAALPAATNTPPAATYTPPAASGTGFGGFQGTSLNQPPQKPTVVSKVNKPKTTPKPILIQRR